MENETTSVKDENDNASVRNAKQVKIQKVIAEFTYLDDDFFTACLQNNPDAALLILRIVLRKPDLTFVKKPEVQYTIKDLGHKSIRLDLYCASEGKCYDVEIQRKDKGAGAHRARYYVSVIDAGITVPGEDYDKLPDVYVIFITQNDIMQAGLPYYSIERKVEELENRNFNDGAHILYVNGAYKGDDDFGKLMHDFRCKNPHEMNFDVLKKPAIFFKETEEGRQQLSSAVEKLVNEEAARIAKEEVDKNKRNIAINMIRADYKDEEISKITGLPIEEVVELRQEAIVSA